MKPKPIKDWRVDILGKRFSVQWSQPEGGKDFGQCDSTKCVINVDPNCHRDQQRDTLIHEVMHGIDHEMDTGMREKQVRLLATGWYHFMRANPEVVKWLMEPEG